MKETKLQPSELEIVQNNNGLKLYLRGLSTGKNFTPRSSLFNIEGKTQMLEPDDILAKWRDRLSALQDGTSFEQEVFQFDSKQLEKWGPQGGVAPIDDLLEEVVLPTFNEQDRPAAFSTAEWKDAKRQVLHDLLFYGNARSLRPAPYARVVDDMRVRDTLESNSGWPLFTRRNKREVVKQSIEEAENGLWKTYPAIALFRNYNGKTRLVWMFPMSANLVEGSFFQPLQSKLMNSPLAEKFLAPWKGFETVRGRMTEAYDPRTNNRHSAVAASDFSSTDAHFQLHTSLEVFDVISKCFQPKYRDALKESILHMHNIPLVIGVDRKIVGEHGVSSGSNWTNFIETIFDMIFANYVTLCEIRRGVAPSAAYYGYYAIGDDMSWITARYDPHFSDRLEEYGNEAGQIVKAEKTTNDRDKVKSLQRLFQRGYLRADGSVRAVYPTIRALKSLVYPERMHKQSLWSRDMAAIRAIMILENTVDHPLYVDFVKFVASGDPNLVLFANKSAAAQDATFRKSKLVPGLNTTYNQERRDSAISEFKTVQILKTL